MQYRTFPGTGVAVSEIGFGTWTLATGWWGEKTDDEAVAMLRQRLEGKYTEDTVFPSNDHRRHRPRSWLINGLKKVEIPGFLTKRMILGQAALKWLLAELSATDFGVDEEPMACKGTMQRAAS